MQTKSSGQQGFKQHLTTITIIHGALVMGLILMLGVAYSVASNSENQAPDNTYLFLILVPVLAIGAIIASFTMEKIRLKKIKTISNIQDKFNEYRTTQIIKYALIEGPALLAIISYMTSSNVIFLGYGGVLIGVLIAYRPSKYRITKDMDLSQSDLDTLSH